MVNYNPYLDETATPSPIVSQSELFNLSKPIEYVNFGGAGGGSIKLPVKNYTNLNNSNFNINFTFLEPFESSHVVNCHANRFYANYTSSFGQKCNVWLIGKTKKLQK